MRKTANKQAQRPVSEETEPEAARTNRYMFVLTHQRRERESRDNDRGTREREKCIARQTKKKRKRRNQYH